MSAKIIQLQAPPAARKKAIRVTIPPPPPEKDEIYSRSSTSSSNQSSIQSRPVTARSNQPTIQSRPATAASNNSIPRMPPATRPMTASSRPLSFSTSASSKRTIKYATEGKYAGVELVPQPSDDPDDPLNWPQWRKELNFGALILCTAVISVEKTILLPVTGELAMLYMITYPEATSLTGVPLILSAFMGVLATIVARFVGKRPVYLVSMALVFIGSMWATRVDRSFAECMAARVFQSLGWGAFDSLVLGSIYDTFFEHHRNLRVSLFTMTTLATTWGPPALGGLIAGTGAEFTRQFVVLAPFVVIATAALVFGCPETTFNRSALPLSTPATSGYGGERTQLPRRTPIAEMAREQLKMIHPMPYKRMGLVPALRLALEAPRALVAPTTLLLFMASFLPLSSVWGLSLSLPLHFTPMPFMLTPAYIGVLLLGPALLAGLTAAATHFPASRAPNFASRISPKKIAIWMFVGTVMTATGTFAVGSYVAGSIEASGPSSTAIMLLGSMGGKISYAVISFLLALVAAGYVLVDGVTKGPLVKHSSQFTSSNLAVGIRSTVDMEGGVVFWRALFAGIFVLALPSSVGTWDGLRATCIGLGVATIVVSGVVGGLWCIAGDAIRSMDGRVMGLVDWGMLKRTGSFFDAD